MLYLRYPYRCPSAVTFFTAQAAAAAVVAAGAGAGANMLRFEIKQIAQPAKAATKAATKALATLGATDARYE